MFEGMMMRFQEDTARHLFRMQIIGPDGAPIETPEQLALAQAHSQAQRALQEAANGHQSAVATQAPPVSSRAPSTTIDALEREFHKKKQRELELARSVSTNSEAKAPTPRRTGEKVGRNDECPCGSGKKYKKCHGAVEA